MSGVFRVMVASKCIQGGAKKDWLPCNAECIKKR